MTKSYFQTFCQQQVAIKLHKIQIIIATVQYPVGSVCVAVGLTASLELEDVEEGDSGEEEGDERSEGDGEEEFDEVLL